MQQRGPFQRKIIEEFDRLRDDLLDYTPQPKGTSVAQSNSFLAKLFSNQAPLQNDSHSMDPKGIYLFGTVGCGKTMLMDMFFDSVPMEKKNRVHFHSFMQDFHKSRLSEIRNLSFRFSRSSSVENVSS